MTREEELPAEIVQAIGAALLLRDQAGGGLFGRLAYSAPRHSPRPAELSVNRETEDDQ